MLIHNFCSKYPIPEEFLQRIEDVFSNTYSFQKRQVVPREPLAVICHGDYLRNNIAFAYETDSEVIFL